MEVCWNGACGGRCQYLDILDLVPVEIGLWKQKFYPTCLEPKGVGGYQTYTQGDVKQVEEAKDIMQSTFFTSTRF